MTGEAVAQALADLINNHPDLFAAGVIARVEGNVLIISNATITDLFIDDPGLTATDPRVPGIPTLGWVLLFALIAISAANTGMRRRI